MGFKRLFGLEAWFSILSKKPDTGIMEETARLTGMIWKFDLSSILLIDFTSCSTLFLESQ
jgi:hypothetical protein